MYALLIVKWFYSQENVQLSWWRQFSPKRSLGLLNPKESDRSISKFFKCSYKLSVFTIRLDLCVLDSFYLGLTLSICVYILRWSLDLPRSLCITRRNSFFQQKYIMHLWWLILSVNLTVLRDVQIAVKTLFLGMCESASDRLTFE